MLDCTNRKIMAHKRKNKEAWAPTGFEEWGGYMAAKKAKLEEQFQERAAFESKNNSTIFQGICVFVNGYTKPSADEIRLLMMQHSGVYHHYMRPRITTHIIASNLPYSKIMMHKKSQNPLPIVKPEWITDSINAGKLLNYQDYLLYSQHTRTQPKLAFGKTTAKTDNTATELQPDIESISSDKFRNTSSTYVANEVAATKNTKSSKSNLFSDKTAELSISNSSSKGTSPIKVPGSESVNSTKNPEFLSEFYNNSRLHHISTMGTMFKDYINELRDKSDKTFPGLQRLKQIEKSTRIPTCMGQVHSDSEEELTDSPVLNSLSAKQEPVIMHIDMDCFFVSVGLRKRPELRGLPVAVTHSKGKIAPQNGASREAEVKMYQERLKQKLSKIHKVSEDDKLPTRVGKFTENSSLAEIASCSYEARKAGVKNGMFMGQALKLCPNLKTISYDFDDYTEVSYALYDTVATYTLDIEAVSCDEMYADCTKIIADSGLQPLEFATIIRKEINEKTGCPVSTGFGQNKLQARLATRKAKPNGQFHLQSEHIQRHMSSISIRDLPGVGTTINYKLNAIGVHTCAELQSVSLGELQKEFGKKTGEMLYNMCRGIDNSKLNLEHVRKSVSAEVNYGIRFENTTDAEKFFKQLSEEVCNRLTKAGVRGRCITLKLMIRSKNAPLETAKYMGHGLCDHFTKSKNLISPVNNVSIILKEILSMWHQSQQLPEDVRGIGIQISRLEPTKKCGNSDLMSFIGKTKRTITDNKPNMLSGGNVVRESQPNTSNVVQIYEHFPSVTTPNKKLVAADTSESSLRFNQSTKLISESYHGIESANTGKSGVSKTISDITQNYEVHTDFTSCSKKPAYDETAPSTSGGDKGSNHLEPAPLMEDIDKSVLAALPEDIRNEVITASKKSHGISMKTKQENPPLVQKKQDFYFKESKRNIERPKKSEMPPIQEIDLEVLLELPDDIRNEILNEYRAKAKATKQPPVAGLSSESNEVQCNSPSDETNLSISQVDPDVLAALPTDIQNDVKNYCANVKIGNKSKSAQIKEKLVLTSEKNPASSKLTANQRTKWKVANSKNIKTSKSKQSNEVIITENIKRSRDLSDQVIESASRDVQPTLPDATDVESIQKPIKENVVKNIKSLSMIAKSGDPHDQKAVLGFLVQEFMNLSLREVKLQIQSWISESDSVNDVDFLAFTSFLSSLPKKKRIEDLHVLLKTMHRCIERTGLCLWHQTYRKTVEHVQRHMLAMYDSCLMISSIECQHPECGNIGSSQSGEMISA